MKTYKKIDIFIKHAKSSCFDYFASTNKAKNCKEAKARFLATHPYHTTQVKASFSK